jgi:hypothetical protein
MPGKKNILSIPTIPKNHKKTTLLITILAIFFSLQMVPNGNFGNSLYYFGDDLAHLAYINELRFAFPPQNPAFAGIPLKGYHFFNDFLIANIANTTFISHFSLYFHFMPLFVTFGWAFGTYSLIYEWTKKLSAVLWGVFFVLFGSSFAFILFFFKHPGITLHSSFGIDQPLMALWNAPYAFSVVIILAILLLMHLYTKSHNTVLLLLIGLFVGITPIFKVYAGIIVIGGFGIFALSELLRKNFIVLYAAALSLVIFITTFEIFSGQGAGLFYFPLWPIERMFDQIFPTYGYKEKIDTYKKYSVIKGLFFTHVYTLSIFLIGNLGTRFIGILFLPIYIKKIKIPSTFSLILFTMLLVSITVPLFFAQTIKVFDMIQMTWYYPVLVALFAALGMSAFFSLHIPKIIKVLSAIIIIFFTLPLTYETTIKFIIPLLTVKRQSVTNDYFVAMNYLKTHGSYTDTVLELPLNPSYTNKENITKWFYSSSPDIPAFGNKRMYIANQYIVFPNMPVDKRLTFLTELNRVEYEKKRNKQKIQQIIKQIKEEKISYIYANQPVKFLEGTTAFSLVFKNTLAYIYKTN